MFYDWQFGFLNIWLFAESDDDAADRAVKILEQLPYERSEVDVPTFRDWDDDSKHPMEWRRHASIARQIGLALRLDSLATGAGNEEEFDTSETP
jgi:hypothetical protein